MIKANVEANSLLAMRFFILTVNVWSLEAVGPSRSPEYGQQLLAPSEIGLAECSLVDGVGRLYQQLVDPHQVSLAERGEMLAYSKKYHGIWLTDQDLCSDYATMVEVILDLLKIRGEEKRPNLVPDLNNAPELIQPVLKNQLRLWKDRESKFLPVFAKANQVEQCKAVLEWLRIKSKVGQNKSMFNLMRP